jgi:hypothetical protein
MPLDVEEIVHDVVIATFELGDSVHEECNDGSREGDGASLSTMGLSQTKIWREGRIVTALTLQCWKKQFRNFTRDHGAQS